MELMVTVVDTAGNPDAKGLQISGNATVSGACELKKVMVEALDTAEEVILDVGGITDSDPTFFQLLCAAHQSAAAQGKRVRFASAGCKRLRQLAAANGFHPATGCCLDNSRCPLHKEGEI